MGASLHIINVISDIENAYQPALRVTIETGHKNAPDAGPIYYRWVADPTGTKPGIIWASFCRQEKLPSNRGGGPSCLQRVGSGSWTKANRNTQDAQQIRCVLQTNIARVDLNRDSLKSLHEQATGRLV